MASPFVVTEGLIVSLAMLADAAAGLRTAQHHAAQAAAAHRAAGHLRSLAAESRFELRRRETPDRASSRRATPGRSNRRASDTASRDFPAGPPLPGQAVPRTVPPPDPPRRSARPRAGLHRQRLPPR